MLILLLLLLSVQNKLCTIQFFSLPSDRLFSQSLSSDHGTQNSWICEYGTLKKPQTHKTVQTPRKKRIFETPEKSIKEDSCPSGQPSFIN